jgi:cell fate regulator YaaT (PSP1 superfamily)
MAVSFERHGRLHYLDPAGFEPAVGDKVLVPTDDGPEVAECVWASQWVSEEITGMPRCAGLASADDLERDAVSRRVRVEAKVAAKRLIRAHGLAMKVLAVDYTDRRPDVDRLVTIYFSAPDRVDFRGLVRDLAGTLRARVDLRQLSERDQAKVTGGIGACGRDLCCSTFLRDFEPVSVRMAKDQDLPLNPLSISGACGRLLCCLKYEHPLYAEFKADAPALGTRVDTPEGPGTVVGHDVPREQVVVRLAGSGRRCGCSKASVCAPRKSFDTTHGDGSVGSGQVPGATGGQG